MVLSPGVRVVVGVGGEMRGSIRVSGVFYVLLVRAILVVC